MKKKFTIIFFLSFILLSIKTTAQQRDIADKQTIWKEKSNEKNDSTSLLSVFKNGKFSGNVRYYFMGTNNESGLSDYYANALGGALKFETAQLHNFQFGVSGSYIVNLGSSDLTEKDPVTNGYNRYEIGLFDIQNPANKYKLGRLEQMYLKYHYKNSNVIAGKQHLNTPFINLQDGRMRPTAVNGIWVDFNEVKKTKINLGYLYGISPRSTMQYSDVGESIGIYPSGLNPDGTKSNYLRNLESSGIYIISVQNESIQHLKVNLLNQYTENIFNSALLQMDYTYPLNRNSKLLLGFQTIHQNALNSGGNEDQSKTYFQKNGKSQTYGGRIGWKNRAVELTLNYNRITAKGRYLMPREWGRDPFYTFMPRERNEGFGDVNALMTKIQYTHPKKGFKANLSAGYFELPDVKNFELNKYGLPSYIQTNTDLRYEFQGPLKGFDAQLLYVYKINIGETYGNKNYVFNKTNMSTINFILNYNF